MSLTSASPSPPWYESNLLWGPTALGVGVLLAVVAAMKADLRWLLWLALPCFLLACWTVVKQIRQPRLRRAMAGACFLIICGGLYRMYVWLQPATLAPTAMRPQNDKPVEDKPAEKKADKPKSKAEQPNQGPNVGSINQGPCSVAQIGGTANQAIGGNCEAANPNRPVVVYEFNGIKKTVSGPGRLEMDEAEVATFKEMRGYINTRKWKRLADLSEETMKRVPNWPTPYFAAGEAYACLYDQAKSIEYLEYFKEKADGGVTYKDAVSDADKILNHAMTPQACASKVKTNPGVEQRNQGDNSPNFNVDQKGQANIAQIGGSNNQAIINERRGIDKKTHDDLLSRLSTNPDASVQVVFGALNGDGEAIQYASDLHDVFEEARWTVNGPYPFITAPFHGVLIACQSASLPAAKQALVSLKASGIPVAVTENSELTDKQINIIVGLPKRP